MIVTKKMSLEYFDFWSHAREKARVLDSADFARVEDYLIENYPDGVPEGEINDLFAHCADDVAAILGYDSWDGLEAARTGDPVQVVNGKIVGAEDA